MEKHFCTCLVMDCPNNPNNPECKIKSCDACMQKIIEMGEVPACVWLNMKEGIKSTSQWSMVNFSKAVLEEVEQTTKATKSTKK